MSIKTIDPQTLQKLLAEDQAILVDVREHQEVARERIPAAQHVPLSAFNPEALRTEDGKIVVYHCATGGRTMQFGFPLAAAAADAGAKDAYHLGGGLMAWKSAGLETEGDPGMAFGFPPGFGFR